MSISHERICQLRNAHPDMLLNDEGVIAFARAIEAECRVPDGWQLVPMEPTASQLDVAVSFALNVKLCNDYNWSAYMRDVYARMLAAAPKPDPERKHEIVPTMAEPDCECGAVATVGRSAAAAP